MIMSLSAGMLGGNQEWKEKASPAGAAKVSFLKQAFEISLFGGMNDEIF